jgi:hypothetical protein
LKIRDEHGDGEEKIARVGWQSPGNKEKFTKIQQEMRSTFIASKE